MSPEYPTTPFPTLQTWLANGPTHRPSAVLPVVQARLTELVKAFPPCWKVIELPDRNGLSVPAVRCTFGKAVVDSETIPFDRPLVSKLAVLHSEACVLAYVVSDRHSDSHAVSGWDALPYRSPHFLEVVAEFLTGSGVILELMGARASQLRHLATPGTWGTIKFAIPPNERAAALKAQKQSCKLFRRLRPRLREVQARLTQDLRSLN
jgi:hypothetical protein